MNRILLLLVMIASFGCANAQPQAEIKFDKTTYDFGAFPETNPVVTAEFEFTNVGNSPLVIHQAVASCGCTVPDYTKEPIMPGKKGMVKVTYDGTGTYPGNFKKSITVRTNSKTEMIRLYVQGSMTAKDDKKLSAR